MGFKKRNISRSDTAAFRGMAELHKQGESLGNFELFDFEDMLVGSVKPVSWLSGEKWLYGTIAFKYPEADVYVIVRTPTARGYSAMNRWEPERIQRVEQGDVVKEFVRTKYPDHVYWSRGKY